MRRIVLNGPLLSVVLAIVFAAVLAATPLAAQSPTTAPAAAYVRLQPGIERAELITRSSAAAQPMRVWIYRPAARVAPKTWPCVLVAAAGSTGATGVRLVAEEAAEHLPYVKQGFIVVAYEVDGAVGRGDAEAQYVAAIRAHVAADGGLANLRAAIELATRAEPSIDTDRLYAAGHSSAATLALRAAAMEPRIRGAVAYAPHLDLFGAIGEASVDALDDAAPGLKTLLRDRQPLSLVPKLRVPTMLFHAADDETAPAALTRKLADAMTRSGNPPLLMEVPQGGHVEAMLSRGLEAGATWLADRAKRDGE